MNKAVLMGRLTRNPVVRVSTKGLPFAGFTLAVIRRIENNGEEETDYIKCITFDKQAEFAKKYIKQGSKILVVGRMQNYSYIGNNGQSILGLQIIVEEVEFAESKVR
ncbi:single-stranded DNA-binding protein [Anaerocolumna chitinilytica]|uniref:Single-stranded DNA-binding protein n=1 Tax=Anaerocolumna chitinilytica TaxID=1727145 RepID=A0A7I8DN10_9FIRM|nr:single-stranded DNA-binding protein [Anaerocolumna chitinilytica]BCJ98415.1 hypothetical protein bsdcttw_14560 [Anaerocolumna chitinilytica]